MCVSWKCVCGFKSRGKCNFVSEAAAQKHRSDNSSSGKASVVGENFESFCTFRFGCHGDLGRDKPKQVLWRLRGEQLLSKQAQFCLGSSFARWMGKKSLGGLRNDWRLRRNFQGFVVQILLKFARASKTSRNYFFFGNLRFLMEIIHSFRDNSSKMSVVFGISPIFDPNLPEFLENRDLSWRTSRFLAQSR